MQILKEYKYTSGGVWQLVKYDDDFFAYGSTLDINSFLGVSVDQCGTRGYLLEHCCSILELCKDYLETYRKNKCDILVKDESENIEMLENFISILKSLEI